MEQSVTFGEGSESVSGFMINFLLFLAQFWDPLSKFGLDEAKFQIS